MNAIKIVVSVALLLSVGTLAKAQEFDDIDPTKGCSNPADIVFVLDESGSIWGPHFTKQLEFVEEFVNSFDVRAGRTHIGVETFGTDERIIFHLGEHTNDDELKQHIRAIKQMRGETFTDKALETMRTKMFPRARPGIPHVGIVITDGESNYPDRTAKEARLTHDEGIQMFAVGVGPYVNTDELRSIASSQDYVFEVDNYDALEGLRQMLAWKACQVTTLPPTTTTTLPPPQMIEACTSYRPLDLIWALPDGASDDETEAAVGLVEAVTDEMVLGPHKVQVGVSPRYCLKTQQSPPVHLGAHDTAQGLRQALAARVAPESAMSHAHLQYIRTNGMHKSSGGRDDVAKIAVLIIDSTHGANLARTLDEVEKSKQEGLRIVVVGVGANVDADELNQIATSPDDVIMTSGSHQLDQLKSDIIARLCNGLMNPISKRRIYLKRYFSIYKDQ